MAEHPSHANPQGQHNVARALRFSHSPNVLGITIYGMLPIFPRGPLVADLAVKTVCSKGSFLMLTSRILSQTDVTSFL